MSLFSLLHELSALRLLILPNWNMCCYCKQELSSMSLIHLIFLVTLGISWRLRWRFLLFWCFLLPPEYWKLYQNLLLILQKVTTNSNWNKTLESYPNRKWNKLLRKSKINELISILLRSYQLQFIVTVAIAHNVSSASATDGPRALHSPYFNILSCTDAARVFAARAQPLRRTLVLICWARFGDPVIYEHRFLNIGRLKVYFYF